MKTTDNPADGMPDVEPPLVSKVGFGMSWPWMLLRFDFEEDPQQSQTASPVWLRMAPDAARRMAAKLLSTADLIDGADASN